MSLPAPHHAAQHSGSTADLPACSTTTCVTPPPLPLLPQGFEKTGLGERVANIFVAAMGKSTLGLSIGLNMAEALVAPAMPSTTARAGGIFMPVIKSLSDAAGSKAGGWCDSWPEGGAC
jgi:hypothetical protein